MILSLGPGPPADVLIPRTEDSRGTHRAATHLTTMPPEYRPKASISRVRLPKTAAEKTLAVHSR